MNTISHKELEESYLSNPQARQLAKEVFGTIQPSIYQTGFYRPQGANWSFKLGIVFIKRTETNKIFEDAYYEIVTRFGVVEAARRIYIPEAVTDPERSL